MTIAADDIPIIFNCIHSREAVKSPTHTNPHYGAIRSNLQQIFFLTETIGTRTLRFGPLSLEPTRTNHRVYFNSSAQHLRMGASQSKQTELTVRIQYCVS
uniref:Uncharacterized protein n=1 Tax=Leptocylindrus danicus TaxID=163516 RepID=A0A7S2K242_9STRA